MSDVSNYMIGLIAGLGIFALIFFIFVIALYVIQSLALMGIAQKKGIDYAWLAWIPIGNLYIIGKVVGPFNFITDISKPELILPILSICGFIPAIGWILSLAGCILVYAAYYNIFKEYRENKATTMLILTIFFGFITLPIYFHSINKQLEQQQM